ncbi:MAG: ABC transporter ATP-binding protein [Proteobacteria bacterium]|nr:ABC transporter ATP-binding protein [Pseudomonadota bacterium]
MADERDTILSVEDLEVRYASDDRDIVAVTDVSFAIERGQCLGLVGESGCGKSTIAMAILRYLGHQGRISKGRILFQSRDMAGLTAEDLRALRGGRIAAIYQGASTALNPTMAIGAQLAEVLRTHAGLDRNRISDRVLDMLAAVGISEPSGMIGRFPHQISGGQQQRVVIAMAFLAEPELLILDEPTTALDVTVEAEIMNLLGEMRAARGTAMLFISHNLGLVRQICHTISVMYAGQIVEHGSAQSVLDRPRHPYTIGMIACVPRLDLGRADYRLVSMPGQVPRLVEPPRCCTFMDRCAHAREGTCDRPMALEDMGGGARVRCSRWREVAGAGLSAPPAASATPILPRRDRILSLEGVSKTYEMHRLFNLSRKSAAKVRANDLISLELAAGETLGIVGESGCGKSTLARIVTGLEVPTGGWVRLLGGDVTRRMVERRSLRQVRNVQMVFQNPDSTLNPSHSVGFILERAVKKLGAATGRAARRAEVERLLDLVRMPRDITRVTAAHLSGGQKQRVAVARAFAGRPSLVVADEPTSALDTSVKTAILELLLSAQKESGTALIFISHDLAVVRYIADRIAVMYLGQIVEIGRADEVFTPPYHPYCEALLAAVPAVDGALDRRRPRLTGEVGRAVANAGSCLFAPRCARAIAGTCERFEPPVIEAAAGHLIRCHLPLADLCALPPVFGRRGGAAQTVSGWQPTNL